MSDYDISKAFKRIENDLMDSMMRNLARHQAEETELGFNWEQWQALQLKELERFRAKNAKLFPEQFNDINKRIESLYTQTSKDAQVQEEAKILNDIKQGKYYVPKKDVSFFNVNDAKLKILIERTKADFTRAEYAILRKANDQYRKIIFDAQVYANITNDYKKAVDMATHDYLKNGLQSVQYKNGAKHNISDYAEMAIRTGNKRAYLMGEGNAHDEFGIHTVRVNKRTQACPKCVGFLGKVLIDDVYAGGTAKEASEKGVPLLSQAIAQGFLHPNCKDVYSLYIEGVSRKSEPWTKQEIESIVGDYNQEQELKHAQDMQESYARMAKYSLDKENQERYQARADGWQARIDEINATPPVPVPVPAIPTIPTPPSTPPVDVDVVTFSDNERQALEEYVSGDGMWINQYLRDNSAFGELTDIETEYLNTLTSATNKPLGAVDKLYRSVDASVIFSDLNEVEIEQMMNHLRYGTYDKGAYSQGIKRRMEDALKRAKGKEITEKGFMSTTVDKKVAEEWGSFTGADNPVVIEFDTKGKKLKGADLDFLDIEDDPQRERLLARNTRYKITDIGLDTAEDGSKYIKVNAEIIDQIEDVAEATEEVVDTFDRNNITWSNAGKMMEKRLDDKSVDYLQAQKLKAPLTDTQIIDKVSGGDQTQGSCVSVALSYIANKYGLDVLDFRGGQSRYLYSAYGWNDVTKLLGITAFREPTDTIRPCKKLLGLMEEGKEYLFSAGKHTSIVRTNNGVWEYLELQSEKRSGWQPFEEDVILFEGTPFATQKHYTVSDRLKNRFGVGSAYGESVIVEISQYEGNDEFRDLIGYINTEKSAQQKGVKGGIK